MAFNRRIIVGNRIKYKISKIIETFKIPLQCQDYIVSIHGRHYLSQR